MKNPLQAHADLMRAINTAMKEADTLVDGGHNSAPHLAAMKRAQRQMYEGWVTNNRGDCLRAMATLIDAYHGYLPPESAPVEPPKSTVYYLRTVEGGFLAGDTATGRAAYAYPTSIHSMQGERDPVAAAKEMVAQENEVWFDPATDFGKGIAERHAKWMARLLKDGTAIPG